MSERDRSDTRDLTTRPPAVGSSAEATGTSTRTSEASSTQGTAPLINLPRGGGAIKGLGEKFATNPVTGTASLSVPIATSPGRQGFGPDLALTYDSGAGNGPFGFGWSLSLPAISRKTDKGLPQYRDQEESDVYVLSGAEDLVPVLQTDGARFEDQTSAPGYTIHRYRPRIEGLFSRIERWTKTATGEIHWRSITRDNVTTVYGKDNNSRIADPGEPSPAIPTRIFSWLICESCDDKGNAIVYEYAEENADQVDLGQANERNRVRAANRYLKRVKYGNRVPRLIEPDLSTASWMFEVVFDYDDGHYNEVDPDPPADQHRFVHASETAGKPWSVRPDSFSSHRARFEVRTYRRCRRILMFHHIPDLPTGEKGYDGLVRSTEFDYADLDYTQPITIEDELAHQGSTRFASFVRRITQSGYVRDDTQSVVVRNGVSYPTYLKRYLPPLEFEYSKAVIQDEVHEVDTASLENLPVGLDGSTYQWVDLHGEGIPGILTEQAGAWFYKRNISPLSERPVEFGPLQRVGNEPNLTVAGGHAQFMDLAGDGQLDLVVLDGPMPGLYEHDDEEGWQSFRPFASRLNRNTRDRNLRFIDLDGDAHADILITDLDGFMWHPSLVEEGFGPAQRVPQALDEQRGPCLVFNDGTQSIYLADMCGDGLTDLVRIRNGETCYWPNLGYGRFGAKVALDNAPWFDDTDQFDQRRIRLADIDGSGTNDIIYLHRDGIRIYFNQSGNRLSEARQIAPFPSIDNVSSVIAADLRGNGTACLVWSSPLPADARHPLRYIDLMGGVKPHLLVKSINNLGAETEVHYRPSTYFYLKDRLEGRPWVTRLPFPVHVVERVVTHDLVSRNRFLTRHAYHHGYFDGVEREFQGFGMVEQWDTEEYASLLGDGAAPAGATAEESSHLPPVLTKTWFHTGSYRGRDRISNFFAGLLDGSDVGEYYREPGLSEAQAGAQLLDDTILPHDLTVEEEREACRALKGSMLREETYALDGTDKAPHPYIVTEQNYTVQNLQPRGDNRHGVFFTHARESISHSYEREPSDPRISHALTLEVDAYGNVLESAAVGYGRGQPDPSLPLEYRARQSQTLITYMEHRVTRAVDSFDNHRTPLPCESRTYDLSGLVLPAGRNRFTFSEILNAGSAATELAYETQPTPGRLEKRLIEHVRTYYRRNDLSGTLPLGELESLALPFESYKLAFTPGLVSKVYSGRASSVMLRDEGRYVHTEGDLQWWIPSGQVFYSPTQGDSPAQELTFARANFYLPRRHRDPFHTNAVTTESFVSYDVYDLLVQETRDALNNRITVGRQDYRVLQPALIIDYNRNRSAVAFDALGMVVGTAVMGKPAPAPVEGDSLVGFRPDLTQDHIDQFLADPTGPLSAALLSDATTRVVYDLTAYWRESHPTVKPPAVTATLVRETHASEPVPAGGLRIQSTISYSDGFGREIQRKKQAESGPVPRRDPSGRIIVRADGQPELTSNDVSPRWVGTGWTVFNNKGKPVRQYEPFFTDTHRFEFDVRIGVSPVILYDPVERVVATLHPSHSWEKVKYHTWLRETWDASDTVLSGDPRTDADVGDLFRRLQSVDYLPTWHTLRTEAAHAAALGLRYPDSADRTNETLAAEKTQIHAGTPTIVHADSLGRPFLTVAHNRLKYSDTPASAPPLEEFYSTRTILDIEGNQREFIDAKNRVVMRYDYDMLGNRIHQTSMEAGERWMLNDVAGKLICVWDSRNHRLRTTYDALQRPKDSHLSEGGGADIVVGRIIYGESHVNPEAGNLRGQTVELRDQAGVVISDTYDFKGNLRESRRQLAEEYKAPLDWSTPVSLEPETFSTRTQYDALNRPTQLIPPHSNQQGTKINVIQPRFNESNLLEKLDVWLDLNAEPGNLLHPTSANLHAITDIDYDAKGQRVLVDYGNGVRTTYMYDPVTFRLTHLLTRRTIAEFIGDCPEPPPAGWPGCQVQNLHYTYDPAGNITHVRDDSQQTIYFRNTRIDPSSEFTYDAINRLIEATGREHLGQVGGAPSPHSDDDSPRIGHLHRGDGNAMGIYLERYVYDAVGNFREMQHRGSDPAHPGWTRIYTYNEPSLLEPGGESNRLTSTIIAGRVETYSTAGQGYDACGGMVRMPHLQVMEWDFMDQLRMTQRQAVSTGDAAGFQRHGERTWYVYDRSGQRVRKVTELAGGQVKDERIYLGGFEIYRKNGDNQLIRETLHITDDTQLVAFVETRTHGVDPAPQEVIRYQFGNHIGSISLEMDDRARIISYEEYAPYGSTTYQAVRTLAETRKRYRYSGKERDEESGLLRFGARYMAPWLGRWISPDDVFRMEESNLYAYVASNPIRYVDPSGLEKKDTKWWQYVLVGPLAAAGFIFGGLTGGIDDSNAPGPRSKTYPRISTQKRLARIGTLFVGGAAAGGVKQLGYGVLAEGGVFGGTVGVLDTAIEDVERGKVSSPGTYVWSAGTGAFSGAVLFGLLRVARFGSESAAYGVSRIWRQLRAEQPVTIETSGIAEQAAFLEGAVPGLSRDQATRILEEAFRRDSSAVFGGSRLRGDFKPESDLDVGFGGLTRRQALRVITKVNKSRSPSEPKLEELEIVPGRSTPTIRRIESPEEFFQRSGTRAGGDPRAGEAFSASGSITAEPSGKLHLNPPGVKEVKR